MNRAVHPEQAHRRAAFPPAENAVEWLESHADPWGASVVISRFTGAGGTTEYHVTVALCADIPDPVAAISSAWHAALATAGINTSSTVMRRIFCSDPDSQTAALRDFCCAIPGVCSVIGQTPLAGGSLALWSQHVCDPDAPLDSAGDGECFSLTRGALRHCWRAGLCADSPGDAVAETATVLEKHRQWLAKQDMTLAENVVRTWWYVRNIDRDYQGLVEARRGYFASHGLTENTHYIASTGIAGTPCHPDAQLSLDSFAIAGLVPGQVRYLDAPEHLGPTHAYGVTFERATAISYADRRHVFISGTASIDPDGNIVHPGDLVRQLDRTLENISALLAAADSCPGDLAMILVYLRDPADGKRIEGVLRQRLGKLPMILLHAPVCRPGWLVEIEGIAMVTAVNPHLPEF